MPAYNADGTVIGTAAAMPTAAVAVTDPVVRITAPVYEKRDLGTGRPGEFQGVGTKGAGAAMHLLWDTDSLVRQSEIDALFPTSSVSTVVTPDGAPAGSIGVITGKNLERVSALTFGGAAVTNFKVENDLTIRFVVPTGAAGNTVVLTADGVSTTGTTPATLTGITPTGGPLAGGTVVTATGTNLTGATGATVGGAAATAFTVLDDTSVRFTTPAGTAGAKDVAVTDDSGTVTLPGAFTYA